jgi:hypothetical protein
MKLRLVVSALALVLLSMLRVTPADAEPYLAVQTGYKCNVCHVNPTGGGLRNDFGITYAKVLLPANTVDSTLDTWTGKVTDALRVGGDLRSDWTRDTQPHTPAATAFALEQFRVYGDLTIIPDRLGIYVDEQIAPNGSQNEEAYVRYGSTTDGFYLKGGQFYLPFGWRLQDQTAFVREVSGISMTTPDKGVEFGYEKNAWSAQLDFTNGAANTTGTGHQITSQAVYTKSFWRLGAGVSMTQAEGGDRKMATLFGGFRTGPVAYLLEADYVHDDSFPGGRNLTAGLAEADWRIIKGHNLKFTAEYEDPDRSVAENQQTRYSLIYEYTPLPFLQLRFGYRRYYGIPQSPTENQRLILAELHGYF